MMTLETLCLVLVAACSVWTVLGAVSVLDRVLSLTPAVPRAVLPPVSVLKPLCGVDPSLEACLESFFTQDHPDFELVFGVERADDPALAVVERLRVRHPAVRVGVVVGGGLMGNNPKVRNLRAMVPHAAHDLLLISDSNVRAPQGYLSALAALRAADPSVGIVTNLFVGAGGRGLGSALESVQLAGFCATGVALTNALGDVSVVGKSMLLSRQELDALGGLARVADVLAEDYVLGKVYQHAGRRVVVSPVVIENVLGAMTLRDFVRRHLRWAMMRFNLRPFAYAFEVLTSPLAVLPFAWHLLGGWACVWAAAMLFVRDVIPSLALQGGRELHRPLLFGWLRELVALSVWAAAPWCRHVSWRGHRVRVGAGTLLFAER
jgi:ceramide glucosyltransferase